MHQHTMSFRGPSKYHALTSSAQFGFTISFLGLLLGSNKVEPHCLHCILSRVHRFIQIASSLLMFQSLYSDCPIAMLQRTNYSIKQHQQLNSKPFFSTNCAPPALSQALTFQLRCTPAPPSLSSAVVQSSGCPHVPPVALQVLAGDDCNAAPL